MNWNLLSLGDNLDKATNCCASTKAAYKIEWCTKAIVCNVAIYVSVQLRYALFKVLTNRSKCTIKGYPK